MKNFNLHRKATLSLLPNDYVLKIVCTPKNQVVSLSSSGTISFLSTQSLSFLDSLEAKCNDFRFINAFTILCCCDNGLSVWDLRTKKVQMRYAPNIGPLYTLDTRKHYYSVASEYHVTSGDIRRNLQRFLVLDNMHGGEADEAFGINRVKFSPTRDNIVFSCGSDGNVNCFDISAKNVDDALVFAYPVNKPVDDFFFMNPNTFVAIAQKSYLSVWNIPSVEQIGNDLDCRSFGGEYFVSAFSQQNSFFSVSSDQQENIQICELGLSAPIPQQQNQQRMMMNQQQQQQQRRSPVRRNFQNFQNFSQQPHRVEKRLMFRKVSYLTSGHQSTIRSFTLGDSNFNTVYTGGEDGNICCWSSVLSGRSNGSKISSKRGDLRDQSDILMTDQNSSQGDMNINNNQKFRKIDPYKSGMNFDEIVENTSVRTKVEKKKIEIDENDIFNFGNANDSNNNNNGNSTSGGGAFKFNF